MNYRLNEEKMFADITDGIAIVINSQTGIYFGLSALGTCVFENLLKGASTTEILAVLKNIDGISENIENELNNFINKMIEKELIIQAPQSSAEVFIDKEILDEDFSLILNEYNDAQELLLADPIHEVKEDTGWTPEKDSIGYTKAETIEREKKVEV